jgi:hypothetical protein
MLVACQPMSLRVFAIAAVVSVVTGAVFWLVPSVRADIRRIHTEFLVIQLEQSYAASIRSGRTPVVSSREFLSLVPTWTIDWNSCELRDGAMHDGWGNAVQVHVDGSRINIRSAGPDQRYHTPDDILGQLVRSHATTLPVGALVPGGLGG